METTQECLLLANSFDRSIPGACSCRKPAAGEVKIPNGPWVPACLRHIVQLKAQGWETR